MFNIKICISIKSQILTLLSLNIKETFPDAYGNQSLNKTCVRFFILFCNYFLSYMYPLACGVPPAVANGNIASYTGTVYMDTASVTCNTNFQATLNTISCLASGVWQAVSCTPNGINHILVYIDSI